MVDRLLSEIRTNHLKCAVQVDAPNEVLIRHHIRFGELVFPTGEDADGEPIPVERVDGVLRVVVELRCVSDGGTLEQGSPVLASQVVTEVHVLRLKQLFHDTNHGVVRVDAVSHRAEGRLGVGNRRAELSLAVAAPHLANEGFLCDRLVRGAVACPTRVRGRGLAGAAGGESGGVESVEAFGRGLRDPILDSKRRSLVGDGGGLAPKDRLHQLVQRNHHRDVTSLDEIDNRDAAALESRLPLVVDVVRVNVTRLHLHGNHRVGGTGSIGFVQTHGAGAVVVIDLRLELPVVSANESLLAALPHFTNRNVVGEIRLEVEERAALNESFLGQQDSIVDIRVLN